MTRWSDLSPEHREWLEARRADGAALNELYRLELAERDFPLTPETHCIVSTMRVGGGVSITVPTHEGLYFMTGPGGYWNAYPPGFVRELVRRKTCPILQRGQPIPRAAALDYVMAMQWGGRSCVEAWSIIAQHDCQRLYARHLIEIQCIDDLPKDEAYREAWRRSSNGGPVYVDEALARAIDEQRKAA